MQLHPGDVGWHWRFSAETVAGCLRSWRDGDAVLAVGLVEDDGSLIRLGLSPRVDTDVDFPRCVINDLADPGRGILTASNASVEARFGRALGQELNERGWQPDEPWTPLVRDLHDPVEQVALDVRVVGTVHIEDRVAAQRASFPNSTFTVERWHAMAKRRRMGKHLVESTDVSQSKRTTASDRHNSMCTVGRSGSMRPISAANVRSCRVAGIREVGRGKPQPSPPAGPRPGQRGGVLLPMAMKRCRALTASERPARP